MQQNNYIEAEDAYRRALTIAPDNNKMCNLGICLMKQGRITEAKENLRRVKPAVADGPRGTDSHLKAYERAQQMLKDLESDMLNKGGDRVEQSRLFDAFLGSSSIWQPQPCKDHASFPPTESTKTTQQDDFYADENINSNLLANQMVLAQQKSVLKQVPPLANSLNIAAQPFYSTKYMKDPVAQAPTGNQFPETLKRTRSGNAASSTRLIDAVRKTGTAKPNNVLESGNPENKARRLSFVSEETRDNNKKLTDLLPDNQDFEDAIIAAVLGSTIETKKLVDTSNASGIIQGKIEKRLKVFQDITLSLSPRA